VFLSPTRTALVGTAAATGKNHACEGLRPLLIFPAKVAHNPAMCSVSYSRDDANRTVAIFLPKLYCTQLASAAQLAHELPGRRSPAPRGAGPLERVKGHSANGLGRRLAWPYLNRAARAYLGV